MHEWHYLDLAKINRHPKNVRGFRRWLTAALKAVQHWLEHPDGIDEADLEFCGAVVRRGSQTARRLGAGHLSEPVHGRYLHSDAMTVLGRMRVWCDEQLAKLPAESKDLTIKQAAKYLNIGERTMHRLVDDGVIPHYRTGRGRGTKRIELAALENYKRQAQEQANKAPAGQATLAELRALVESQAVRQRQRAASRAGGRPSA